MAEEATVKSTEGKLLQLPLARIKMIMKSSPVLNNVSQEGYYLIARSAANFFDGHNKVSNLGLPASSDPDDGCIWELFAQYFAEQGFQNSDGGKELTYKGLASSVETDDSLDFLGDVVPQKVTMSEYWKSMAEKKE